ncbi:transcriptional regulator STERILE APETALA [Humulus lupulus]|uniref:transcriptional regulator STERILE APETALA n=1 Tax=Humulus lupulus TaxID=3486 RepID=UPI002B413E98|nr:transcriptional regulator STERILE APETALA [Humulus lupulus]
MSSSSSSSSLSSSFQGGNNNANAGASGSTGGASSSRRRGTGYEGPSSSQRREPTNEDWPGHFVEALIVQVAVEAARTNGRLAAAPALATVFLVCPTWREASRSDHLWHRLTRRIWGRAHLRQNTWRDEYIYWHQTADNFRLGHSSHTILQFDPNEEEGPGNGLTCRCLTLSDTHLACGFSDGSVRLFYLPTRIHVSTFRPRTRAILGPFSRAITGIVITNNHRIVFGTLVGDIHVALINGPPHTRRVYEGNAVDDGVLVDFTGCGRWWVGLYAGVPDRAFHIWDGNTEELVSVGGALTNPESVRGWQMLIEANQVLGRVRVTSQESAVACTATRAMVLDLRNHGLVLDDEEYATGLMVTSVDVSNSTYIIVDRRGNARVRRAGTLEELCRFSVRRGAWQRGLMGCMNRGYALMCGGSAIRVWEIERGHYLYRFPEQIEEVSAMVADERHVVACSSDSTLHLWDFGAQ